MLINISCRKKVISCNEVSRLLIVPTHPINFLQCCLIAAIKCATTNNTCFSFTGLSSAIVANCISSYFRHHVPILFYLLFHMNNLFIVINSSINVVVYYCVGKDFRKEAKTLYKDCKQKFCMCFC